MRSKLFKFNDNQNLIILKYLINILNKIGNKYIKLSYFELNKTILSWHDILKTVFTANQSCAHMGII